MNQFLMLAKGLLFLVSAALMAVLAYLVLIHPELNFREQARISEDAERAAQAELQELEEWHHHEWSDIDVESDQYPIVFLRDSFKILQIDPESAVVGWRYELINTSPKQAYTADVQYTIQDQDGFDVAHGSGSVTVQAKTYNEISGTLDVSRENVRRLAGSRWTIRLNPDWQIQEAKTEGTRYERLTAILQSNVNMPSWIPRHAQSEDAAFLRVLSDKWKAIAAAYSEAEPASPTN